MSLSWLGALALLATTIPGTSRVSLPHGSLSLTVEARLGALLSTPLLALNHYLDLPDVALVARRTRSAHNHDTRGLTVSVEFRITSLPRTQILLAHLAHIRRRHWTIENVTHYPCDGSCGEDRCHVRSGSAPQALAAFRNAIVGALHVQGWPYLPNGYHFCRSNLHISWRRLGALAS